MIIIIQRPSSCEWGINSKQQNIPNEPIPPGEPCVSDFYELNEHIE